MRFHDRVRVIGSRKDLAGRKFPGEIAQISRVINEAIVEKACGVMPRRFGQRTVEATRYVPTLRKTMRERDDRAAAVTEADAKLRILLWYAGTDERYRRKRGIERKRCKWNEI